ncbi:MAG: hypothetical protein WDM79_08510 [Terricaulis sp.]
MRMTKLRILAAAALAPLLFAAACSPPSALTSAEVDTAPKPVIR